jgi:hypothetical protein
MEKTEFKGTKGPWKIGKYSHCVISENTESLEINGSFGADSVKYYGGNLIAESISTPNALLISKAPEMLEMLKKVANIRYVGAGLKELESIFIETEQLIKEATNI